jgi:hypothetical protein
MLIEDLDYYKTNAGKHQTYHGMDKPNHPYTNKAAPTNWWEKYPTQDFDYQFNSWGFRGPEYEEYIGKPVILCMGDSNTVNVGEPIENSWPSQLSKLKNLPCINLGMDGAGNDAIRLCYNRAVKLFDVQETFVMYSYFHRRLIDNAFAHFKRDGKVSYLAGEKTFLQPPQYSDEENLLYWLEQRIPDAHEVFIPPWCFNQNELRFIRDYTNFMYPHDNGQDGDYRIKWSSRDFHHINWKLNKIIAEYFYELSNSNT